MEELIRELVPHAPKMGLYVKPHLPTQKVQNALRDYAPDLREEAVVALYDATVFGSAKDGAVFTADLFVFQNNDLQEPETIRYEDLVGVTAKRRLGVKKVQVSVNRGRATFELLMDFSGQPEAAGYVERFLHEAMLRSVHDRPTRTAAGTDLAAVRRALDQLREDGHLADADYSRLLDALGE